MCDRSMFILYSADNIFKKQFCGLVLSFSYVFTISAAIPEPCASATNPMPVS